MTSERRVINPWQWQDAFGFVQGNALGEVQRTLLCAGQTSVDGDGAPLHPGDMRAQLAQALDNLEVVLGEAGYTLADVARLNYYTTDVARFMEAAEVLGERLAAAGARPAATLLGVNQLFHPDLMVELEATAVG